MSNKLLTWVWDHSDTKGMERLVLIALADQANDQGICWPSMETIAKKANISRRYTIEIIGSLEDKGLIQIEHRTIDGKFTSNYYKILTTQPGPVVNPSSPRSEPQITTPDAAVVNPRSLPSEPQITTSSEPQFTGVVNPSSLKSLINPDSESSVNHDPDPSQENPEQPEPIDSQAIPLAVLWKQVKDPLRAGHGISGGDFATWIDPVVPVFREGRIVLQLANDYGRGWLEGHFLPLAKKQLALAWFQLTGESSPPPLVVELAPPPGSRVAPPGPELITRTFKAKRESYPTSQRPGYGDYQP